MAMTREQYNKLHQQNMSKTGSNTGFRLVLTPAFEKNENMTEEQLAYVDKLNMPIEFDLVSSQTINSSSQITSYPTVEGDTIADHMWRQPDTISISGKFSMFGNKPTSFAGDNDRLTNIENFFEKLKNEAVFCSLTTMERGNASSSKQRFKTRDSMVLTSISWTEEQASLSYTFSFTEALTQEVNIPISDSTDENLPDITDASTVSFVDELVDMTSVMQIIVLQLQSIGAMEGQFWENFVGWLGCYGTAVLEYSAGIAVGTLVGAFLGIGVGIGVGLLASGPVGWIAAGIVTTIGAVVGGIWALVKSIQRQVERNKYAIETFKAYEDDVKQKAENERFMNYSSNIYASLNSLNDVISLFKFPTNTAQECMIYIDDAYYIFTTSRQSSKCKKLMINGESKTINYWQLDVSTVDRTITSVKDMSGKAISTINNCNGSTVLFKTDNSSYQVYLVNKNLFKVENSTYNSDEEREQAILECQSDLTNYEILISQIDMSTFNDKLKELIVDAMQK